MDLTNPSLAVCVKSVIDDELSVEYFVIILETKIAEAFSNRLQTWSFWFVVQIFRYIRTVYDSGKHIYRAVLDLILFNDGFEAAFALMVAKLHTRNIERNRAIAFRGRHNIRSGNKDKLRLRVNKLFD